MLNEYIHIYNPFSKHQSMTHIVISVFSLLLYCFVLYLFVSFRRFFLYPFKKKVNAKQNLLLFRCCCCCSCKSIFLIFMVYIDIIGAIVFVVVVVVRSA